MGDILGKVGYVFIAIAYLLGGLATISGIGYTFYNWGSVGLDLGPSAWLGFVLFAKMVGGAIVSAVAGVGIFFATDHI